MAEPPTLEERSVGPLPSEIANLELPAEQVADVRQKLQQIGLALMNYESARNAFPPAKRPDDRPSQLSWRVHILPYMDQGPLFKRFKLDEPWDSAHNSALLEFMPDIYRTGDDPGTGSRFAVLAGEQTMFPPGGLSTHASCRDGAANTLLAVHAGGGKSVPWTKPEEVSFEPASPWRDLGMINGRLEGVLVDGQTISVPFEVGADTIVALATARGNEIVDGQGLQRRYSPDQGAAPQPGQVQREAMNRLKGVGMASLTLENAQKSFPAAAAFREREGVRSPEVSWRVQLLPYMEQMNLFRRYQMKEPWDSATNQELLAHMPGVYRHEASQDDSRTRLQALVGEGTPFYFGDAAVDERGAARGPVMRRLVDGSSNTIMFVESGADRAVPWMEPRDLPFDQAAPLESLGDLDATGTYAVMFDGSVRVIAPDIDPEAFKSLALSDDRGAAAIAERRQAIRVPSAGAAPSEPPAMSDESSAAVASANGGALKLFQLPRPAFHAAYDETTGHLMTAEEEQNQATLYEVGDAIREIGVTPAPAKPCVVLCKRYKGASYFLVGGMLDRRIDVFQAGDGKRAASLTIGTPCIEALSAGRNDADPYVYYESALEGGGNYVGRLNVATMQDEGYIARGEGLAVSADGKLVYLEHSEGQKYASYRITARPAASPPTVGVEISPVELELSQYSREQLQGDFVAHPDSVVMASGELIRNYWIGSYAGRLEFPVWAFWSGTPWAFGMNGRDLGVASLNDSRTVTTLSLSDGLSGSDTRSARMKDELKHRFSSRSQVAPMFVDAPRGRLLITSGDQVGVVSLDQLNLPDEPFVAVKTPPTGTFGVGKTYQWPIATFDSRVAYSVLNAPGNVKVKAGAGLTLQASDRDVGIQEIVVEAKFDRFKREQMLLLDVRRPSLPIPLDEMEVSLSANGAMAVVWGLPLDVERAGDGEQRSPNLFVVDVASRQIKARQRIPDGVRCACISGEHVYVLAGRGERRPEEGPGELLQLGVADLKLVKKLPIAGEPSLALAAENFLLAGREIYEIPALTKLVEPPTVEGSNQQLIGVARWLAPGWNFGGAIWNAEANEATALINPPGFVGSSESNAYRGMEEGYRQGHRMLSNWGRLVGENYSVDTPERNLLGTNSSNGFRGLTVPGELPAILELYVEQHQSPDLKSGIRVREMAGGTVTQEIVLGTRPVDGYSRDSFTGCTIAVAGPVVVAAIDRQLYFVPTDAIDRNHLQAPFRIALAQNPLDVSGKGQATLKYELLDGESPYELKAVINGAELRGAGKRSVSVELDVEDMVARVLPTLASQHWPGTKPEQDPRARVVDYVDAVTPYFKWLMGREPKGVPVLLSAEVEATDRGLNVAKLPHSYFLELPEAMVVKTLVDAANGKVAPYVPKEPSANPRANDPERKRRIAELDKELVKDYSEQLRKKFPAVAIDDKVLERRAKRSVAAADTQLNNRMAEAAAGSAQNYRTWRDKKGHSTKARLKSVFGDEVVLQTAAGNEVKISIDKFSPEDVEFIEASDKPMTLSRTARTVVQMQILLDALQKHASRTGSFPPGYLVGSTGEPTMSWRVAILPDLGANDLFRMFHFDETWESEHNRKLLAYMPAVFRSTDSEPAADRTAFLGLRGTNGILSNNRSIGVSDVRRSLEPPIVLVEAAADGSLEWTMPRELESFQQGAMEAALRSRDGQFLVGSADGALRTVPAGTPEIAWQKAINHSDSSPSQIEFGDPITLSEAAEE